MEFSPFGIETSLVCLQICERLVFQKQSGDLGRLLWDGKNDLVVTNIGTNAFTGGETFQLFAATGTKTGNFDSVTILPATGATGLFDPATGVLTISVGVPELTWTNLGGGVLEFFFDAASKLVWQTNALAVGLSSNWVDYPGGDTSPVSVTNNPAVPATFFGLQPK